MSNASDTSLCSECLQTPPFFDNCICAWRYELPIDGLIQQFKYQRRRHLGRSASLAAQPLFKTALEAHQTDTSIPDRPDFLLPVPSSPKTLRSRYFNQAEDIATDLGKYTGIPVRKNIILRKQQSQHQAKLSRSQRFKNLNDSFSIKGSTHINDAYCILIDDVVTTGATVNTLSGLLKQAGARRVDVWALARTARHGMS